MTSEMPSLGKSIRARAPVASSSRVRKTMQATPSRDTTPEKALRSISHRLGLRFRKDKEPVEGVHCKADIVFQKAKLCVFIDGCFWHGCSQHFRLPKTNTEWWLEKLKDNQERDKSKTVLIKRHGWKVLRYWEHELQGKNLTKIARKIYGVVKKRVAASL